MIELHTGDCRELLRNFDENSFDACVTDPPYELGFMGKKWDKSGAAFDVATWREVLRVLKPGAHLIAFGGTRTYHRQTCAIEEAGFEIRDCIMWVYGSGFPKSLDVSKAIDKAAGEKRQVVGPSARHSGQTRADAPIADLARYGSAGDTLTAPATDAAREWTGWGTALKPALEPIVLARKPLVGTVAANVLAHGTGALNINASKVDYISEVDAAGATPQGRVTSKSAAGGSAAAPDVGRDCERVEFERPKLNGRWPANLIHDGSEKVVALFPCDADAGSAARFFYTAKVSQSERGRDNTHPTVKPLDLMRYLCKLVTQPGGKILDPFAGSGSTGIAAEQLSMSAVLIDIESAHVDIQANRIRDELGMLTELHRV